MQRLFKAYKSKHLIKYKYLKVSCIVMRSVYLNKKSLLCIYKKLFINHNTTSILVGENSNQQFKYTCSMYKTLWENKFYFLLYYRYEIYEYRVYCKLCNIGLVFSRSVLYCYIKFGMERLITFIQTTTLNRLHKQMSSHQIIVLKIIQKLLFYNTF